MYDWDGLSPVAPLEHSYELTRVGRTFRGRTVCRSGGREQVAPEVTIPVASLAPLLERLSTVSVTSGPYTPLVWHTDDYPDHTMELQTRSGVVSLTTRSQGEHWVPWEITASGTSGVVQSIVPAEVMREIIALLHGIDCNEWARSLPREGALRR